jgi:glycosyltransferase involved in cell wall biosynthesis
LSHTLLEVSALGAPIVCTGVCGNPEVVEHEVNGLLVPPKAPDAVRDAVRRVLDEPGLGARFVAAGLARMDRFSRDKTFGEVESALQRLLR